METSIFHQMFSDLREDIRGQHTRQSEAIANLDARVHLESVAIQARLRAVENAVLVIQTERQSEERLATKRGAYAGIIAAVGLTALWEVIKGLWGTR